MDAGPVERHRVYYKGEGVGFPKGEGGDFPKSKGEGVGFPKGGRCWLPQGSKVVAYSRVRAVASPNTQGCPKC